MNAWMKKLAVPENNETREIDVAQTWEVRWTSRHGSFHSDTRPELESFLLEREALDFKESLERAFALTRNRSDERTVTITKAQ